MCNPGITNTRIAVSLSSCSVSSIALPAYNGYLEEDDEIQPLLDNTTKNEQRRGRKYIKENLTTIPGAWIDEETEDNDSILNDDKSDKVGNDKEGDDRESPKLAIAIEPLCPFKDVDKAKCQDDIECLKQAIASLKEEQEELEKTNQQVKKSIQSVAKKRTKAIAVFHMDNKDCSDKTTASISNIHTEEKCLNSFQEKLQQEHITSENTIIDKGVDQSLLCHFLDNDNNTSNDKNSGNNVFIMVSKSDFVIPPKEELNSAGLDDSWEWITTQV
ncbi:hypothetical protein BDF20DRAFT_1001412 [Mycotypha africana]|uniref:uncharacterized protein n=1 Tax=Mycotypha africana TaxID=64632 RepID=UPI0023014858|nr:uncharacterized protein BDF20DRAFT_1001412 [Mycotypha africana]KAI8977426.1 hypothetical protein BDF20DRAFT_1001412 [Mycotypha africana]